MKKAANEIDRHVGGRVRMRRMIMGMSQERLGEALGLTFQQVQKYEKGTNRISASRLRHIADVLGVSITYLYEGAGDGASSEKGSDLGSLCDTEMLTADALKLLRFFHRIEEPKVRRRIVDLVAALASPEMAREPARSA